MKFKFRLDVLMRQRKAEQDVAQREYAQAQKDVRDQLALIDRMYSAIDSARDKSVQIHKAGGPCASELQSIEEFIDGQKIKIARARQKARELMAIEESKHEVLVERVRDYKIIEKLKERKRTEFKKMMHKKEVKQAEDIMVMKFSHPEEQ